MRERVIYRDATHLKIYMHDDVGLPLRIAKLHSLVEKNYQTIINKTSLILRKCRWTEQRKTVISDIHTDGQSNL